MGDLRVESFAHRDGPLEDFLEIPRRVEGLGERSAPAERRSTAALLDPSSTYYRNGTSRCFIAFRGNEAVGRIAAFHNRLLKEKGGTIGLVGLFACQDDREAARVLIKASADWLREAGIAVMRGPMAGDIWHRWRFMTRGFDTVPFPGEPRQPAFYPELFLSCGFAPVRVYSTKLIEDLPAQLARFRAAMRLNERRGYTFRHLNSERWSDDMNCLYELCQHSFAVTWSMTPTTVEEVADIYDHWLTRVGSNEILLAEDSEGVVCGLGLAVAGPEDTLNIRTIAVLPEHCGCGLGQAIAAELYKRAITSRKKRVHHCLMGPMTQPQRWDHGHARVTREYSMYERAIG